MRTVTVGLFTFLLAATLSAHVTVQPKESASTGASFDEPRIRSLRVGQSKALPSRRARALWSA